MTDRPSSRETSFQEQDPRGLHRTREQARLLEGPGIRVPRTQPAVAPADPVAAFEDLVSPQTHRTPKTLFNSQELEYIQLGTQIMTVLEMKCILLK